MRVRRAHENRVGLARQVDVVAERPLPGQQAQVFLAAHRLADVSRWLLLTSMTDPSVPCDLACRLHGAFGHHHHAVRAVFRARVHIRVEIVGCERRCPPGRPHRSVRQAPLRPASAKHRRARAGDRDPHARARPGHKHADQRKARGGLAQLRVPRCVRKRKAHRSDDLGWVQRGLEQAGEKIVAGDRRAGRSPP